MLVEFHHIRLRNAETRREVPQVPRVGDSVTLAGSSWVVYGVHWWEPPVTDGGPVARLVLRTPDEWHRALR